MRSESPETPTTITDLDSEYEILGELGRGGMAIVYLARDRELGREVAIKVIRAQFVEDEEAMARFAREARTVAQLHHPNIVTVHAVKRLADGSLALVMHHVPGRTLKEAIRREGPLSVEQVERVLGDVAEALGFAHERGIIHRDVKPENILLDDSDGRARLFDFGIARSTEAPSSLTLTGIALGTPAYMSPEQIEGAEVDGRSDLYSLGLVGWEMLTGRRPWEGEGLYSVIFKQKNEELTPLEELRPEIPARLRLAIEGALQKDPELRWKTADDLLAEMTAGTHKARKPGWQSSTADRQRVIAAVVAGREQRAAAVSPDAATVRYRRPDSDPPAPSTHRRSRRGPMRVGIAVAGLLLFSGSAAVIAAFNQREPPPVETEVRTSASAPAVDEYTLSTLDATPAAEIPFSTDSMLVAEEPVLDGPEAIDAPATGTADSVGADGLGEEPVRSDSSEPPRAVVVVEDPAPTDPEPRGSEPAPSPPEVARPEPRAEPPAEVDPRTVEVVDVAAGGMHSCVLSSGGAGFCWGGNDRGQLGNGSTVRHSEPVPIAGDLRFRTLAAGVSHTCGIARDGQTYCWGANDSGQLGDGSSSAKAAPVQVAGSRQFARLASGMSHTCGVTAGGEVYCWGSNAHGQLGDGSRTSRSRPAKVAARTRLERLALGWEHTCALSPEGFAFCWGENGSGQLGDGITTNRSTPSPIAGSYQFRALAAGSAHTCGVLSNNQVVCWGKNNHGQLGSGSNNNQTRPIAVQGAQSFTALSAGSLHTCGINRAGQAYCWGRNNYGQLGDGSTFDKNVPVRVQGGHLFRSIDASGAHTCGVTTAGERLCWGYNLEGQLGDGTRTHRSAPVPAKT